MSMDPGAMVGRALVADAARAGCAIAMAGIESRRWASATFSGARHRVGLSAHPSPQFDAWLARLPDTDFAVRGHLVADLSVEARRWDADKTRVELAILTVEER